MKKLTILFILSLFFQFAAQSQACLPDGIHLTQQEQIDNFQTNYPNCTEIEGDVLISGKDITNLNGLSILTSIGGHLRIKYNYSLTSMVGLEGLTSIGYSFEIWRNDILGSLAGLQNLTSIGESLEIGGWGAATTLDITEIHPCLIYQI